MNYKVDYEITSCAPEVVADMYEELVEGFYKTAVRIRDRAVELVPYQEGVDHQHLRDTIRARRSRKKNTLAQALEFLTTEKSFYKDDPAAFVIAGDRLSRLGDPVFWHYWVEYGTYSKPARPYMRPAMMANFDAVLAEAERAGKRALNKRRRLRKWGAGHA